MTDTTPRVTRLKLPAVRRAVQATPWAIQQDKLLALLEVLEVHAVGGSFSAAEIQARTGGREARRSGTAVAGSGGKIAVLPLYGVISPRMDAMSAMSGGTSTDRFGQDFDAAMADATVKAIVLDTDSPGGNVQGTPELAAKIFNARGKGKRIVAVSNGTMASAAYWIASAADEIVATPSGDVGSIGVFMVHLDESGMNEQLGLKYTLISAGTHKTEGNPYEPLSKDAEAFLQSQIDEIYGMFVGAVAKHRGVSAETVKAKYGEGRCLTAKQALAAGLVDRIATLDETLQRLGASPSAVLPTRSARTAEGAVETHAVALEIVTDGGDLPDDDFDEDDIPGDDGDDAEVERELCPECGAPMDGNHCSACDYQRADADEMDSNASTACDGARAAVNLSPDTSENTVSTQTTASPPGDVQAAIAAERKRSAEIRALCKKHRVDEAQAEAMITEGLSFDQAKSRVLDHVEARGSASPRVQMGADREAEKPFATFGEQLHAIVQAALPGGRRDPRLAHVNAQALRLAGSPSGMDESVGSEGGFFIQNDLLPGVMEPIYQEDPLLSRITRIPVGEGQNGVKYNVVDETSRVDGSRWGGVQVYWGDEADTATAKKPKLRRVEQALKKLIALAYLTDELLADAPASQKLLTDAFTAELRFVITSGIYRGPGGGQMLGFLKSPALISQAIEATQTIANTNTFFGLNSSKMLSRIPAALWGEVIWLYNQELLPYMMTATIGTGGAAVPAFVPAGGFTNRPFDTILGRPAFASEQCEAVGTPGDLVAIAPSHYHLIEKGGPQQAMSLHVRFLYDEMTLRITQRVGGQPVTVAAVTPYKGANTRSPFVALATRS